MTKWILASDLSPGRHLQLDLFCLQTYMWTLIQHLKQGLPQRAFFQCGHKICTACKFAKPDKHFSSFSNGRCFPVRKYINCNTKHSIYLISCLQSKIQYVGCTTGPLKIRIRRQLSDSARRTLSQISIASRHVLDIHGGDTSNFSFMGIKRVRLSVSGGD